MTAYLAGYSYGFSRALIGFVSFDALDAWVCGFQDGIEDRRQAKRISTRQLEPQIAAFIGAKL